MPRLGSVKDVRRRRRRRRRLNRHRVTEEGEHFDRKEADDHNPQNPLGGLKEKS
jgi:hypothetical protein